MCMEFTSAVNPVEWTRVRLLSLRQRSRPRLKQAITNPSGGGVGCARVPSNAIRQGWCSDSDKTAVPGFHLDSGMGDARGGNFIRPVTRLKNTQTQKKWRRCDKPKHDQKDCSRLFTGRLPVSFPALRESAASVLLISRLSRLPLETFVPNRPRLKGKRRGTVNLCRPPNQQTVSVPPMLLMPCNCTEAIDLRGS